MSTNQKPGELTMEQSFTLASIKRTLPTKTKEELEELVLQLVEQDMVKNNLLKHLRLPV